MSGISIRAAFLGVLMGGLAVAARAEPAKLLVYNSQASDPVAARMETLANASHVPVVGATETEPPGKTYQAWIMGELDAVDHALPK